MGAEEVEVDVTTVGRVMAEENRIKKYGQVVIKEDELIVENFEFHGNLPELRVAALQWAAESISQAIKDTGGFDEMGF